MKTCRNCSSPPAPGRVRCPEHLARNAEDQRARRERLEARGLCRDCGLIPASNRCRDCLDRHADREHERRRQRRLTR